MGAGGGSIASWLCERVGNEGRVLATDLEPCFLQMLPFDNLEVRRHDIRMEGLAESQFDLAHARLVLMHLPGREIALQRRIDSLKPGGWIVVEEFAGCEDAFADDGVPERAGIAKESSAAADHEDEPNGEKNAGLGTPERLERAGERETQAGRGIRFSDRFLRVNHGWHCLRSARPWARRLM